MSLSEFPLNLIPIPGVEVGLDGDVGPGILFHARGSVVLDVHSERSAGGEVVERGRAGELGEKHESVRVSYNRKTLHSKTNTTETIESHHQGSPQNTMVGPVPACAEGVLPHSTQSPPRLESGIGTGRIDGTGVGGTKQSSLSAATQSARVVRMPSTQTWLLASG